MNIRHDTLFIDGRWTPPASDRRIHVIGAATEARIGSTPEGTEADVDRAVAAAGRALRAPGWDDPGQRAALLARFADALERRMAPLAERVSAQNGMPISTALQLEGGYSVAILKMYAALAAAQQAEEERPSPLGFTTRVRREPVGVVGAIVPWNFPVVLAIMKIGPALAAGCTVVLKPSPGTVLDHLLVAEAAAEAGLPPGVLNWVPGGRELGAYLVRHPGIQKVAFTGSTAAGRQIAETCGRLLRPVSLELGGKSAAILLDDVDVASFVQALPAVSLTANGQACFSCTRLLVPDSRYDEVLDAVVGAVSALKVGDPLDPATQIGPLGSAEHRDRVEGYIHQGKADARLVAGGGRPRALHKGWFVEPTVFADVDNRSLIAREEVFGPVLCVLRCRDEEEAIAIANDSEYGLGGTVFSQDRERALAVARRIETGTVGINGYLPDLNAPFGGIKASGLGRELGPEALAGYQQYRSVYVMG